MFLLIDNYDSFTYNLFQYMEEIGASTRVIRNDAESVESIANGGYEGIVLSPGPKEPTQAGVCVDVVRQLCGVVPLLGVCLGHQAIVYAYGGQIQRGPRPVHGKASVIAHDGSALFEGIPREHAVGRYHSLVADPSSFPVDSLHVTARSCDDDQIMALQHQTHRTFGVQYHPESILTEHGHTLLRNFVAIARSFSGARHA